MQIADNNSINSGSLEQTSRASNGQVSGSPVKGGEKPNTSQSDGVQISNFAGTLSNVLQSGSADRSQRIAQLSAAVQSGSYQVDSLAVSRAIIDHAVSGGNSIP